jgi:hypothetical protein
MVACELFLLEDDCMIVLYWCRGFKSMNCEGAMRILVK